MSVQTLDALINDFIAMVETSTLIFEEKFVIETLEGFGIPRR